MMSYLISLATRVARLGIDPTDLALATVAGLSAISFWSCL